MAQPRKPHTITAPFTADTAYKIDANFDAIFQQGVINESGVTPVSHGGTNLVSYTKGDLLYASTPGSLAGLHDIAVGNVLLSGGISTAPAYGKVALSGGVVHITGTLTADHGGTGQSSYAVGDLLYASGATALSKLADIATGNALISGGVTTAPSWGKIGLTTHVSGVLPVANGGTNIASYSQGDLLYASAAGVISQLAKDTSSTRYLSNTGSSNNPAWAQVALTTGVSGILPQANGGTGKDTSAVTNGQLLIGKTSDNSLNLATLTAGSNITITNGAGTVTIATTGAATNALLDGSNHTDTLAHTVVRGDLIVGNSTPKWASLAVGAANRVLRSDGSDPNWGQVSDAFISDVTEAKITDGTILARVAANETISGAWTFTGTSVLISNAATVLDLHNTASGSDAKRWRMNIGGTGTFFFQTVNDALNSTSNAFTITRSGQTPGTMGVAAFLAAQAGLSAGATLSPTSFSATQNDYNPTGLHSSFIIRLNNTNLGNVNVSGINAGVDGEMHVISNVSANGLSTITLTNEDAGSTAANRFHGTAVLATTSNKFIVYDGATARWDVC